MEQDNVILISALHEKVIENSRRITDINIKIDKIMGAFIGDEMNHNGGYIQKMQDHDEKLEELEKIKDKIQWFVMGAVIPSGYGIFEIVKNILIKTH